MCIRDRFQHPAEQPVHAGVRQGFLLRVRVIVHHDVGCLLYTSSTVDEKRNQPACVAFADKAARYLKNK